MTNPAACTSRKFSPTAHQCTSARATRTDAAAVYVALDFDGVLHHQFVAPMVDDTRDLAAGKINPAEFLSRTDAAAHPGKRLFDRCDALMQVIARFPCVRVVAATSWRFDLTLEQIRSVVPTKLRKRIVGVLARATEYHQGGVIRGVRGHLMESWMAAHASPSAAWIAIDDVQELWADHAAALIHPTWSGLQDTDLVQLHAALLRLQAPRHSHASRRR